MMNLGNNIKLDILKLVFCMTRQRNCRANKSNMITYNHLNSF